MDTTESTHRASSMADNSDSDGGSRCRMCGGRRFRLVRAANDFDTGTVPLTLMSCVGCGLVRTEPVLSDEALNEYYRPDYYGGGSAKFTDSVERMIGWLNRRRAHALLRKLSAHERPLRVLDFGCGRANLLLAMKALGCDCYGVERRDFPAKEERPGIHLHRGALTDAGFRDGFFDLVVVWHVLEHLAEPHETLAEVRRVLGPTGTLVVAVPNHASLQACVFRRHWFHLDLPRHRHHFTRDTLGRLLAANGLEPIASSTFAFDQNGYGFVQSALNTVTPFLTPNRFYAMLKSSRDVPRLPEALAWYAAATLTVPFAVLELVCSQMLNTGATLITYARPVRS